MLLEGHDAADLPITWRVRRGGMECGWEAESACARRGVPRRHGPCWLGLLSNLRQQILHMVAFFFACAKEDLVVGYRVPCRMRSGARERERAGALCGQAQQQRGQSRGAGMRRTCHTWAKKLEFFRKINVLFHG